jgi:hypothetical protein
MRKTRKLPAIFESQGGSYMEEDKGGSWLETALLGSFSKCPSAAHGGKGFLGFLTKNQSKTTF